MCINTSTPSDNNNNKKFDYVDDVPLQRCFMIIVCVAFFIGAMLPYYTAMYCLVVHWILVNIQRSLEFNFVSM